MYDNDVYGPNKVVHMSCSLPPPLIYFTNLLRCP
uniref:Uncharacterized protein n=1 Tax=Rhizophora mucronata TaxID=61149 RepID=A0A2P2NBU0_RHIMU